MQIISTKEAFHGHRFQNEVISTELDFEFIIITTYLLESCVLPSQDERERIQEDIPGFKFKKSMLNSSSEKGNISCKQISCREISCKESSFHKTLC